MLYPITTFSCYKIFLTGISLLNQCYGASSAQCTPSQICLCNLSVATPSSSGQQRSFPRAPGCHHNDHRSDDERNNCGCRRDTYRQLKINDCCQFVVDQRNLNLLGRIINCTLQCSGIHSTCPGKLKVSAQGQKRAMDFYSRQNPSLIFVMRRK